MVFIPAKKRLLVLHAGPPRSLAGGAGAKQARIHRGSAHAALGRPTGTPGLREGPQDGAEPALRLHRVSRRGVWSRALAEPRLAPENRPDSLPAWAAGLRAL